MGFFCRCPLLDKDELLLFVRIFCVLVCQFLCCRFAQHLDLSAFQFFTAADVRLLHMDMRQFICHIAGQCCQRIISTQRQFAGCYVAGQCAQHIQAFRLVCPGCCMTCCYSELNRINAQVLRRSLRFRQHIVTVVQALEAEGRAAFRGDRVNILQFAVCQFLLQLELSASQRLACFIDLVDVDLVGKGNHKVFFRLLGFFARLLSAFAVIHQVRVEAVLQLRCIHIALLAQHCLVI